MGSAACDCGTAHGTADAAGSRWRRGASWGGAGVSPRARLPAHLHAASRSRSRDRTRARSDSSLSPSSPAGASGTLSASTAGAASFATAGASSAASAAPREALARFAPSAADGEPAVDSATAACHAARRALDDRRLGSRGQGGGGGGGRSRLVRRGRALRLSLERRLGRGQLLHLAKQVVDPTDHQQEQRAEASEIEVALRAEHLRGGRRWLVRLAAARALHAARQARVPATRAGA